MSEMMCLTGNILCAERWAWLYGILILGALAVLGLIWPDPPPPDDDDDGPPPPRRAAR